MNEFVYRINQASNPCWKKSEPTAYIKKVFDDLMCETLTIGWSDNMSITWWKKEA